MTTATRTLAVALIALCCASPAALAKKSGQDTGTPVTVTVLDEAGEPVPTAVVRHPEEADRHRVNGLDGSWEEARLFLPDGTELLFEPGLLLRLEISAPGYQMQVIEYEIRKRKNAVEVRLAELPEDLEEIEEPMMQFGHDDAREPSSN